MRREEIHRLAEVAVKRYTESYSIEGEDPDYKTLDMRAIHKIGFREAITRVLQACDLGKDIRKEFEDVIT